MALATAENDTIVLLRQLRQYAQRCLQAAVVHESLGRVGKPRTALNGVFIPINEVRAIQHSIIAAAALHHKQVIRHLKACSGHCTAIPEGCIHFLLVTVQPAGS